MLSRPSLDEVRHSLASFSGPPQRLGLPTAPPQPVVYLSEENRPQPRLDADRDGGMTVTVGRLRTCPVLGYKFFALGHNTVRGAAGAAVLNAELLVAHVLSLARVQLYVQFERPLSPDELAAPLTQAVLTFLR